MIDREKAFTLLKEHLSEKTLIKHSLATEAIMRSLARRFDQDEDEWAIAGLLHDLDFETTRDDMTRHGMVTSEILSGYDVPEHILYAIQAHNEANTGVQRKSTLDFALTCAESITGMVVATALVMPDKKLASTKSKSIIKRMKKKDFARSIDRDEIKLCEKIGIPLHEFAEISLVAMREISDDLGL